MVTDDPHQQTLTVPLLAPHQRRTEDINISGSLYRNKLKYDARSNRSDRKMDVMVIFGSPFMSLPPLGNLNLLCGGLGGPDRRWRGL